MALDTGLQHPAPSSRSRSGYSTPSVLKDTGRPGRAISHAETARAARIGANRN
jgi:hypothetical protein